MVQYIMAIVRDVHPLYLEAPQMYVYPAEVHYRVSADMYMLLHRPAIEGHPGYVQHISG